MNYKVGDYIRGLGIITGEVRSPTGERGYWIKSGKDLGFYTYKDLITPKEIFTALLD